MNKLKRIYYNQNNKVSLMNFSQVNKWVSMIKFIIKQMKKMNFLYFKLFIQVILKKIFLLKEFYQIMELFVLNQKKKN